MPPSADPAKLDELVKLAASNDKAQAKAAKKELYRLKSQGVAVPEPQRPAETAVRPAPAPKEDEALVALLSPIDGLGERMIFVARPLKGGGIEAVQAIVSDELGVMEISTAETSRSFFRKQLRRIREEGSTAHLEIARDEAVRRLSHALYLNAQSGTPAPAKAEAAIRHLGGSPTPSAEDLPKPEDGDATLSTEGRTLHDEPELRGWLPPEAELRPLGLKMDEIMSSPLYIDLAQKREQLGRTFVAAAEAFFTPQRKKLYARRLWDVARYLDATRRERKAAIARAEARRLFHDAPGLFSPFAQRLFEKVIDMTVAMHEQATAAAAKAQAEPDAKKSPGGLIIP